MLPLGLHFNLPEEKHHLDPGLGSTDHKQLLVDPCQFQFKRLADLREALGLGDDPDSKESVARVFGSAVHTMALEGRAAFDRIYATSPETPADVLCTKDEIRAKLGPSLALPKSAGLYDYEKEAKLAGFRVLSDWKVEKLIAMEGKTEISKRWDATMRLIDRVLDAPRPLKGGMSLRQAVLTDGYPEVTFIWEDDTGVRLKVRFDWLRPGFAIDLKTYAAQEGREPIDAFVAAITRYAYHMQAAHYVEAYGQLGAAIERGDVFLHPAPETPEDLARGPRPAWLERLAAASRQAPVWTWLAIQTLGMPHADDVQFDAPTVMTGGQSLVREARALYRENVDRFGANDFWVSTRGTVLLEDLSFRPSINDLGAQRWKII